MPRPAELYFPSGVAIHQCTVFRFVDASLAFLLVGFLGSELLNLSNYDYLLNSTIRYKTIEEGDLFRQWGTNSARTVAVAVPVPVRYKVIMSNTNLRTSRSVLL